MCDTSTERLRHVKSLYPAVSTYTDFNHMLHEAALDAVLVATPVRLHHRMARACLEAGKHTFVEKPMTTSGCECEDLIDLATKRGLVLMAGHTFLYAPAVRRIKEIISSGDLGDIQYISCRRLNLGLFQRDINVTWDLAPHDISIVLYLMDESPLSVNCQGSTHLGHGVEDVTTMYLSFSRNRSAMIHSSWLDPCKVREITVVGSKRMLVYDDVAPLQKVRIFDARVETLPHYDTFAEFQYAYHYGDMSVPYLKQEEPLKVECQHFLDCVRTGAQPLTGGKEALEMVRILEAASESLHRHGAPIVMTADGSDPWECRSYPQCYARAATQQADHQVAAPSREPVPVQ
jgi:predicted dehydrogenase